MATEAERARYVDTVRLHAADILDDRAGLHQCRDGRQRRRDGEQAILEVDMIDVQLTIEPGHGAEV